MHALLPLIITLSHHAYMRRLIHAGTMVDIHFHSTLNEKSLEVNFSLACNSSGRPAENAVWTRNGFLLDNTGPLNLVDGLTFVYTNVLEVRGRTLGTYICHIRGSNDQVLSSASFNVEGITSHKFRTINH